MLTKIIVIALLLLAFPARASLGDVRVTHALFASKTPKEIVYPSKEGDVSFNHTLHAKRVSNNCKACHDKLFPESSAPLNYKSAEHKTAEAAKTSCGGCHYPGGDAFEAKGNCGKCHVKN